MSAVTIDEAWPGFGSAFTVAELDRMPDDGHRYELFDGVLVVSPRPTTVHQAVAGRLYGVLSAVCPEDLLVVPEPAVQLDAQTEFDPDLVVVPLDEVGDAKFTAPPLLVVEIRSPSTALFDLNRKKAEYEKLSRPTGSSTQTWPGRSSPCSSSATAATSWRRSQPSRSRSRTRSSSP